jgi:hypothetical protein
MNAEIVAFLKVVVCVPAAQVILNISAQCKEDPTIQQGFLGKYKSKFLTAKYRIALI